MSLPRIPPPPRTATSHGGLGVGHWCVENTTVSPSRSCSYECQAISAKGCVEMKNKQRRSKNEQDKHQRKFSLSPRREWPFRSYLHWTSFSIFWSHLSCMMWIVPWASLSYWQAGQIRNWNRFLWNKQCIEHRYPVLINQWQYNAHQYSPSMISIRRQWIKWKTIKEKSAFDK